MTPLLSSSSMPPKKPSWKVVLGVKTLPSSSASKGASSVTDVAVRPSIRAKPVPLPVGVVKVVGKAMVSPLCAAPFQFRTKASPSRS